MPSKPSVPPCPHTLLPYPRPYYLRPYYPRPYYPRLSTMTPRTPPLRASGAYPRKFDVYHAVDPGGGGKKRGVGLTTGLATSDGLWPNGAKRKQNREALFPLDLAERALATTAEGARASVDSDRIRLLNSLCGLPAATKLSAPPDPKHERLEEINARITATFASLSLHSALAQRREKPVRGYRAPPTLMSHTSLR